MYGVTSIWNRGNDIPFSTSKKAEVYHQNHEAIENNEQVSNLRLDDDRHGNNTNGEGVRHRILRILERACSDR
jgi:hypothetical protein